MSLLEEKTRALVSDNGRYPHKVILVDNDQVIIDKTYGENAPVERKQRSFTAKQKRNHREMKKLAKQEWKSSYYA